MQVETPNLPRILVFLIILSLPADAGDVIFSDGFNRNRNLYRLRRASFSDKMGCTSRRTSLELTSTKRIAALLRQRRDIDVTPYRRVRVRFCILFDNFRDGQRVFLDVNTGSGFSLWKKLVKGKTAYPENGLWYKFNKGFVLEPGTTKFRIRIRGKKASNSPKFFIDSLRFIGLIP